jgi:hypothetical protein
VNLPSPPAPWIVDSMACRAAPTSAERDAALAQLRLCHAIERAAGELARCAVLLDRMLREIAERGHAPADGH